MGRPMGRLIHRGPCVSLAPGRGLIRPEARLEHDGGSRPSTLRRGTCVLHRGRPGGRSSRWESGARVP